MKWYDVIAPIYDGLFRDRYLEYRSAAVKALQLQPGQNVLDIGCGTGLNFDLVRNEIGSRGTLIGVDFSDKMLDRALNKVKQHDWKNVHVLQRDVRKLDVKDFDSFMCENSRIDRVLCTLGLSVFPDWQAVFERSFDLLGSGGRYTIMDLYNSQKTPRTRLITFRVHANISRRVWEPLKAKCNDYYEEKHTLMHRGTVIVASGNKP